MRLQSLSLVLLCGALAAASELEAIFGNSETANKLLESYRKRVASSQPVRVQTPYGTIEGYENNKTQVRAALRIA